MSGDLRSAEYTLPRLIKETYSSVDEVISEKAPMVSQSQDRSASDNSFDCSTTTEVSQFQKWRWMLKA